MSTHSIAYQYKKALKPPKIIPSTLMSAAVGLFLLGLRNAFELAVVFEPSVFEPLKFYCISL